MFETHNRQEPKKTNDLNDSSRRRSHKWGYRGNSVEDKIKTILIRNTESYEGIGDKMIKIVKELLNLFWDSPQDETDSVYDAISRVMVEFIATQPFKTGIFAGVSALFSTSLVGDSPLSKNSNLTVRILELSIERLIFDIERSNYYSSQLILNFFTEMANFYIIDLSQLVSIYRAFLDICLSLKKSDSHSPLKHRISDHHSFILFTLVAYSLPLVREELRNPESGTQGQGLYSEILKEITIFYDTHIVGYCDEVQKVLLNLIGKDLQEIESVENPFTKYWSSFIKWRDQQCPRIMTILRFYRSPSISDYLAELISPNKDFTFGEPLNDLKLGEVNEYLLKQLIRFPSINSMDIGDFILLRIMDSIGEIFVQSPYETARQLLKLPVTSSSYDLCLSITIWNYLLNPFYITHISFVNSLVISLVMLQSSFFITIWVPMFILNMQPCKSITDENSPKAQVMLDSKPETETEPQKQNCTVEDSNNPIIGKIVNHLIFPHIRTLSMLMLFRLKKHITRILSNSNIFSNSSLRSSFWNSTKTDFLFKADIHDPFLNGVLNSILAEMSRIMLPQTLMSIPNDSLSLRVSKIPLIDRESSRTIIPRAFLGLKEFSYLKDILVFKFTTKGEITEKNDQITKFLKSKIGQLNDQGEGKDDLDEDLQMSRRYEERQHHKEESRGGEGVGQSHEGGRERNTYQDTFKSSKKRRMNSISPQDQFTWTKDSLFDLLLISIIDQGSKSLSHSRRLLANYKTSILGWYCNGDYRATEKSEDSSNVTQSNGKHNFSDQVSQISNGILNYGLFKTATKLIFSGDGDSASEMEGTSAYPPYVEMEIRLLSLVLTIWGGLLSEDLNICLGFSFQKLKNLILTSIEEEVLSPGLASIGLACVLTCIQSPSCLDISSNKNRYQIFVDLFELIIEILNGMKIRGFTPEDPKESKMEDKKHSSKVQNNSMESCVLALIYIFSTGFKACDDRTIDKKLQRLMDDSTAEIFMIFGSSLVGSEEHPGLDLESIRGLIGESIPQLVKDFKDSSLEFALNVSDPSTKLELRWVSSSVINANNYTSRRR